MGEIEAITAAIGCKSMVKSVFFTLKYIFSHTFAHLFTQQLLDRSVMSSTERLIEVKNQFRILKNAIKEIQKRDFLSITPKVEDIKVVYKWIETFNVPHFYFQVFFDKVYGISFEQILQIVSDSDKEGIVFSVETDSKNQNKTTIKINSKSGIPIAYKVDEPEHKSVRKEMDRGRLLFYVTFEGGTAYLDIDNLRKILSIEGMEF